MNIIYPSLIFCVHFSRKKIKGKFSSTVAGNFEEVVSADSHTKIRLINQHLWDTIQMMAEISILNWNGF